MEEKTRPIIQGLGLAFKVISGFMFFSGLFGFLAYCLINVLTASHGEEIPIYLHFHLNHFILKNFKILVFIQCTLSAFIFFVSIQFTKLHRWAKKVLEMFCGFLCLMIMGIALLQSGTKSVFYAITSLIGVLPWLVGVLVLFWLLKKKEVNEAYKK